ncbi:nucleotidyl transferase AbiEii/AbiGii toxin family protein [Hamadaea sp. NPDC050747]|uniref:nucleotidyl transferase AbiEii/AbiGii toxin family protein n=1 Tax=Hamadaea sp. NPDC050747 TaxID=3155789 RepID=UPI00340E1A54
MSAWLESPGVADPASGESSTVELGVDWRAFPPVPLAIGPVLHPVDAAANKLCALFGRAAVRDYIDVYGVLKDGRYTGPELQQMAADHDPGFEAGIFAEALQAVTRLPASAFESYKLNADQVEAMVIRLLAWAEEIEVGNS